jgi:protein NrfD
MDPTIAFNPQHGLIWDWRVALDLFLGGVGVGAFLLAWALSRFGEKRYAALAQTAAVIAPIAVVAGLSLLFWKLGMKSNVMSMILNVSPGSVMWWGGSIQGLFVAVAALFAVRLALPSTNILGAISTPLLGAVGAVLAVIVGVYHGLLLATVASHPVWANASGIVGSVLLFVITGVAAALLAHMLRRAMTGMPAEEGDAASYAAGLKPVGYVLIGAIALMLVNLFAWYMSLRFGPAPAREALATGLESYGGLIGGVGVVLGLLVPLALAIWAVGAIREGKSVAPAMALASLLLLVGGFAIRFSVVLGGQAATLVPVLS